MATAQIEQEKVTQLDHLLDTLEELLANRGDGRHLSFYVTAGRLPDEARRARIQFRNQLAEAQRRLEQDGCSDRDSRRILDRAGTLLADEPFWNNQQGGLVVLVDGLRTRVLMTGAPMPNKWVYSSEFHLKPLLAAAAHANAYWLLTLSQKSVNLFRGSQLGFRQINCEGLPKSYKQAMVMRGYGMDSVAMAAADSKVKPDRDRLKQFFETVDEAVTRQLAASTLPLLVAGIDYYEPIYREVNRYPQISEAYLAGNVEREHEDGLHEVASTLLKSDFKQSQVRSLRRYKEVSETSSTLDRLDLILAASARGQVEVLFVPVDEDDWGTFDPAEMLISRDGNPAMHNTDLYELAARQTLDTGGEVFFMNSAASPVGSKSLALLRWVGEVESNPSSSDEN